MYLSKLYTPALESRLRTQFPHFQYILDNGEMVPTGIDSNTSHQILNLLPKILINPQIIQNPIFITQNIPQRKQIIQTIQKSITFFNFLNIRLTEEKLLIEKEESDGLWSKYVELMSKLGKKSLSQRWNGQAGGFICSHFMFLICWKCTKLLESTQIRTSNWCIPHWEDPIWMASKKIRISWTQNDV